MIGHSSWATTPGTGLLLAVTPEWDFSPTHSVSGAFTYVADRVMQLHDRFMEYMWVSKGSVVLFTEVQPLSLDRSGASMVMSVHSCVFRSLSDIQFPYGQLCGSTLS